MILMTRRVTFSAAHADWIPGLSKAENQERFGLCASPEPYGHNYILDVGVRGPINPQTGILVNIKVIDALVREHVVSVLDRKFINRQVPAFFDQAVSAENIATFVVDALDPCLPPEVTLAKVRLEPAPGWFAEWNRQDDGEKRGAPVMLLTRTYEFSASHRLHSPVLSDEENRELFGKCNRPNGHGHNYEFEVTVSGSVNPRSGRVLDTDTLDELVNREVVDRWDHRHLNHDVPDFNDTVPSAEVITRVIWERLADQIPAPVRLHRVLLRETARNIFEYTGEKESAR